MKKLNMGYGKAPSSGPLGYAKKGQMTLRPQVHSGKPSMKSKTGIYHGSNVSTTRGR